MSFSTDVEKKAQGLRQTVLQHPFITGIGDGTLDLEPFKFYVRQDYIYLLDYSRVLALASARAPDLDAMGWFAHLLHDTLNTEMELHRTYCAEFGISRQELEETCSAPTTTAYTRFLLAKAYHGSYPELVAALLPCQWGYWEIGNHLKRQGLPQNAPLYRRWIEMYASAEFKALADWLRAHADSQAQSLSPQVLAKMEAAYVTSLHYEYLFWEMSYRQKTWPVS